MINDELLERYLSTKQIANTKKAVGALNREMIKMRKLKGPYNGRVGQKLREAISQIESALKEAQHEVGLAAVARRMWEKYAEYKLLEDSHFRFEYAAEAYEKAGQEEKARECYSEAADQRLEKIKDQPVQDSRLVYLSQLGNFLKKAGRLDELKQVYDRRAVCAKLQVRQQIDDGVVELYWVDSVAPMLEEVGESIREEQAYARRALLNYDRSEIDLDGIRNYASMLQFVEDPLGDEILERMGIFRGGYAIDWGHGRAASGNWSCDRERRIVDFFSAHGFCKIAEEANKVVKSLPARWQYHGRC